MRVIGIILEANPFHHGHQYLLNHVKKEYSPDIVIAITSSYFTMRAEVSCYSKKEKVKILLNAGFDLVFELPTSLAIQRADLFAKNAIDILKRLNITDLAFGCETSEFSNLEAVLLATNSLEYQEKFSALIKQQLGYKKAHLMALTNLIPDELLRLAKEPNFTLATEYLKNLDKINPIIIKRIGTPYNSIHSKDNIGSATSIRHLIKQNLPFNDYLPNNDANFINLTSADQTFLKLCYYLLLVEEKRLRYDLEGIGNYILKNGNFYLPYDEFLKQLASPKLSKTRIRRYLINLALDCALPVNLDIPYLRLLGMNNSGISYLNSLSKNVKDALFSSPNDKIININIKDALDMELKAAKLFSIITNEDYYKDEYKFPLRKD